MSSIVSICNLTKRFSANKPPALDNVSAEISEGKIVGVIGPDGAGKTTLLRVLVGLLSPDEGGASVLGYDCFTESAQIHRRSSYMPQKFGLYGELSVRQNLKLYAKLRSVSSGDRENIFHELLAFTGLERFQDRLAKNLSGGMQQKLGLCCALVRKPKVLILDEPTVGIDPISRREFWRIMEHLRDDGISILWSTSYLDEAERCEEVLLFNEGKLLYFGPPQTVTDKMAGRTFLIEGLSTNKRQVYHNAKVNSNVEDCSIQGSAVKIVMETDSPFPTSEMFKAGNEARIVSTLPRFEDAFIDILGGTAREHSRLSDQIGNVGNGTDVIIEGRNLTKAFGKFIAVQDASFKVHRGEIFGLLGPNGAGKSTTFRMLCGLSRPTKGDAFINGVSLRLVPGKARAQIGYMAQKFSLYGNMTVLQNLRFFTGIYNVEKSRRKQVIDELVEIFSLEPYLNSQADELPLGFKQRLALSCAVAHGPEVLFLDEATSGVDPVIRREFWNHIHGIVNKGCTIMVSTHFMDEAEYCDRIGLLSNSRLATIGSPDALKEQVKSAELPNPTLEDAFVILGTKGMK